MISASTAQWIRRGLWIVLAASLVWACGLVSTVAHDLRLLQDRPGCASGITMPLLQLLNWAVPIAAIAAIALITLNGCIRVRQWPPLLGILLIAIVAERALWLLYPFLGFERVRGNVWWLF